MWILQSDWLFAWRKNWLYLITWVGIVTSPTYSFANDIFKKFHEIIGFIHMRNKSRYPQRNRTIFPRKYFIVHKFEQELSRFNLKGVTWQFAVIPYFLSESAIKAQRQGHRKIRSRGKVFLKFQTHPHQLSVNNKLCSFFCCCYFIFQIESFP
jgi:hypothetical protein